MDRLNKAATTKVASLVDHYSSCLANDIAESFNLDPEKIREEIRVLTQSFFMKDIKDDKSQTCAWFTKRGEKCNKDRKLGHEFCSVHAEYFILHDEEVNRAKTCPDVVNVTRRGISKNSNVYTARSIVT